jgi:hypothetical protein
VTTTTERTEDVTRRYSAGHAAAVAAAGGLVLWGVGSASVDLSDLGGFGLAPALPWPVWAGIVLVTGAFVGHVARPRFSERGAAVLLVVLVFVLYGLQPLTERLPRTTTVWLHLGFVERFVTDGAVATGVDARFSWPGFFAASGLLRGAGGFDLVAVANWFPVVVAAGIAALTLWLARYAGSPRPVAWLAAGVVTVTNWIEQDYFSPQAVAFLLALGVIVLLLGTRNPTGRRAAVLSAAVIPVCVLAELAIVVSHQLTPPLLGIQLLCLLVAGDRRVRSLLLVLIVAELTWFVIGAREFWTGQLALLTDGFGDVGGSVGSNVTNRLSQGDPGLVVVRLVRVATFGLVVLVAALGARIRARRGRPVRLLVFLAAVPWIVTPLQSYGGELYMRCALFGLPYLSVLVGEALWAAWGAREARRHRAAPGVWRRGVVLVAVSAVACTLVFTRGGNDGFSLVTPAELSLASEAVDSVPAGGLLLLAEEQGPVRIARVGEIRYGSVAVVCDGELEVVPCALDRSADVVLFTRSMVRWGELSRGSPAAWADGQVDALVRSGRYEVMTSGPGGIALRARTQGE